MQLTWEIFRDICENRKLSMQWIDLGDSYELRLIDGMFVLACNIVKTDTNKIEDFETNFKPKGNASPTSTVTTQFEKNDKDLKLARARADVDAASKTATVRIKIPGIFGNPNDGRWVAGGYAFSDDYRNDDYVKVHVEDLDKMIAWGIALQMNPGATEPLSDSDVQQMGEIPGLGAFPEYPIVKSYTDEELPEENRGWYFWPMPQGSNLPPLGECEVEPIGGYGFIPAGFYIRADYIRSVETGAIRLDFYWGKTGI